VGPFLGDSHHDVPVGLGGAGEDFLEAVGDGVYEVGEGFRLDVEAAERFFANQDAMARRGEIDHLLPERLVAGDGCGRRKGIWSTPDGLPRMGSTSGVALQSSQAPKRL